MNVCIWSRAAIIFVIVGFCLGPPLSAQEICNPDRTLSISAAGCSESLRSQQLSPLNGSSKAAGQQMATKVSGGLRPDSAEGGKPFRDQYKSKSTALLISGLSTMIPVFFALQRQKGQDGVLSGWLFEMGTGIGPGIASLYAEDHMRAVEGIGIRGMLSLSMALTNRSISSSVFDLVEDGSLSTYRYSEKRHDALFVAGATVYAASIVYNVLTSLNAVEEHNKMVRNMNSFTVKPHVRTSPSAVSVQVGFSLNF